MVFISATPPVQAEPLHDSDIITDLSADNRSVWLERGISYFFEPTPMSHTQVARLDDSRWTKSPYKSINLGASSHPVWLRFDLRNLAKADIEWLMEINWGYLNLIELFLYHHDTGSWKGPMISGNMIPMEKRIMSHRLYLFPLDLEPHERTTVYLRVVSTSKLIIPIKIWQKQAFRKSITNQFMSLGLFFGILMVMVLYNFLLYIPTKDKSFLYFSFFVFSLILYTLMPTGIGSLYLWDKAVWIKSHAYGLFSSLSFLTAAAFIRRYLWLKRYGGLLLKINTLFVIYWAFSMVFYLFWSPPFFVMLEDLVAFLSTIVGMGTAIYCWVKKDDSARLFSIAWGFLTVGTILLILAGLDIIEHSWITAYSQMLSFTIVVTLLSVALAERINRERRARTEAQQHALALSHKVADERAANLEAQERMLAAHHQANEELEHRVMERSTQLEQAMQRLSLANQELAQLNIVDSLTKVYNRRYFDQVMAEEIQRARRNGQPLAVVIADIDHFKSINDTHGHLIGDECLRLVAKTIQETVAKGSNLIARYGGEEFAIIMPSTSSEDALMLADQTRLAVEKLTFSSREIPIALRISLGVAAWVPKPDETPEKLIRTADKALYHAKQRGRNRVAIAEVD